MMDIIINDTNIFIDLYDCKLLYYFFKLPYSIHTLDFVVAELVNNEQKKAVQSYTKSGALIIKTSSSKEIEETLEYKIKEQSNTNLSMIDCSILLYAKKIKNAKLLTGDRKLKSQAEKEGVKVCGILYIFEQLVENNIISTAIAIKKLELLYSKNTRLPKDKKEDLINKWRDMEM